MIFYGLIWAASVSALVDFSAAMQPIRNADDLVMRVEVAAAVVGVTDDLHERGLLMRIGYWESGYARDVATCARKGDHGEAFGLWQVHPRTIAERKALCLSLESSVVIALGRVRESLQACRGEAERFRLGMYVDGSCTSKKARRQSAERWVSP